MSGTVAVDPRLRERRNAVERERERHRARVVLAVLAVPAAAVSVLLLLRSAALDVDAVKVDGARHVDAEEVRDAAGIERGAPLAFIDTGAAADRVESLAWVDEARISRRWPGTVRVQVTEYEPAAFVRRAGGGVMLVAEDGAVLGPAAEAPEAAVEIVGVRRLPEPGSTLAPAGAAGVVSELPDALGARVVGVDLADSGVTLRVLFGPEIRLGSLDDVAAKGAAALAVMERIGDAQVAYVDVSVPSAPVAGTTGGDVVPGLDAPVRVGEPPGETPLPGAGDGVETGEAGAGDGVAP